MNIVDKLTGGKDKREPVEVRIRRDLLTSQIRAKHPEFGPENIDLSEVDLTLTDEETREKVGQALGIESAIRRSEIDLDEIISPSGVHRRRARRAYQRARDRQRRKGQAAFRRTQRERKFAQGRPSNHEVALLRREAQAVAATARVEKA